jgi:Flavin-binding monooxygenase-like
VSAIARTVAVIGAGPSGLAAAKNFKDAGFEVTVFEAGTGIGGNWRFSEDEGHSSVFETTHIISSKYTSQYADHPFPSHYPDYPSHTQLLAYFESYADRFALRPLIRLQHLVLKCEPMGADGAEGWRVSSRDAQGAETTQTFDALVVANGHHWKPRWPEYPGSFSGRWLHSHQFKRAAPFAGQRVLVIGGGNSACDVAVECSRVAARTDISWRRGYRLVPKFMFGQPVDALFHRKTGLHLLPRAWRAKMFQKALEWIQGRNEAAGLPPADHDIGQTHPTVNSELLYFVRHGKVGPKPDIAGLDGATVHFKDGSAADYDAVVCATGYWIDHPFFDPQLINFAHGPVRLYLRMLPERWRRLWFIGLFQPLGCIWPGAELQSKLAAAQLAGRWHAPSDLKAAIDREVAAPDWRQLATPRHTVTVDDMAFRARLRTALAAG